MSEETPNEKLERLRQRLNVAQRKFCESYLRTCDASESYAEAYGKRSCSYANQLLGRWYIRDYLEALAASVGLDDVVVTRTEVLATLTEIMRNEVADAKDRISAAKTIAQVRGFAVKKVEHSGDPERPVKVRTEGGLTPEQITELRASFLGIDTERAKMTQ